MEGEIKNYLLVWTSAILSLYYCHGVSKVVPKGILRLIPMLPVMCLFVFLPLQFLTSYHLGYSTAFCLSWVANFKLLLLSFGTGPLSDPSLPLSQFLAVACLPIIIAEENPTKEAPIKKINGQYEEIVEIPSSVVITKSNGLKPYSHYAMKAMYLPSILLFYAYRESLNPKMLMFFYMSNVYIGLEVMLALCAIIAQSLLGVEVRKPFDEPLLSTSIGDYWGKRWNLISSDILRLTIFRPIYNYVKKILGRTWAYFLAIMATFLVSGLMHELLNYQLFRTGPNWGYTYFFVMQGLCVVIEGELKKKFSSRWHPPRVIVSPMIIGFIMITFVWLVILDLMQKNVDTLMVKEYVLVYEFLMSCVGLEGHVMPLFNRAFGNSWNQSLDET
ncbi:long-chain-alcohol O-fatty-acyltransferase-like [Apium graveolens]|uniref:long-chain-alcohol O-fatty-acyltransferase-like n=1 Tax=Apium graveolens TaxID=4045 RepID=UPI003D7A3F70